MADLADPTAADSANGHPILVNGGTSNGIMNGHLTPTSNGASTSGSSLHGPAAAARVPIIGDEAFLLYEEAENEDLPAPTLPTEMLVKIMAKLDTPALMRSTMLVSKRWNLASKQVALVQAREIEEKSMWTIRDLRAYILKRIPQAADDVIAQFANQRGISVHFLEQLPNVKLLMFYYRTYFDAHNEVGLQWESVRGLLQGHDLSEEYKPFLRTLSHVVSSNRQLVFMANHGLIIRMVDDQKLQFFAKPVENIPSVLEYRPGHPEILIDIVTDHTGNGMWVEYHAKRQNDSAPPSLSSEEISMFEDSILATGRSRRTVVYFRVQQVDHRNKRVAVEYLREIFTPFFIRSSLYFNGKIYILYENCRFLGQWTESTDALSLSEAALPEHATEQVLWSFCRIANLIFLAPARRDWPLNGVPWPCLDGSQDALVWQNVNMSALVMSIQPNRRDLAYGCIKKVYSFNNLFIAICNPTVTGGPNDTAVAPLMISVSVMRRTPKVEDFLSEDNFRSLFYLDKTRTHKVMGTLRSDLFYYLDGVNLLGNDDGGAFILRILRTFTSEP